MRVKGILTVDFEDWFHGSAVGPAEFAGLERHIEYAGNRLLDLLDKYEAQATFFVLGDIVENHPGLVREIVARGHEVASHGYFHKTACDLTPLQFKDDLSRSVGGLEDLIGKKIESYRAPFFSMWTDMDWAYEVMQKLGIKYDSSVFPAHNYRFKRSSGVRLPYRLRKNLWECPISVYPSILGNIPFSGGAYYRIIPGLAFQYFLNYFAKHDEIFVAYLHPYDIDEKHWNKRIQCSSTINRIARHYRLKHGVQKFEHMFSVCDFGSLTDRMIDVKQLHKAYPAHRTAEVQFDG